ncbi:MAG: iron-sulfur cluster assembly accessory protein [Gammaproteobacteria bacterium]|nr:iron-sulfur cluster assembly accessory protein [Gammaproteobacteria bacterium]
MIEITEKAAKQIKQSAIQTGITSGKLRVAIKKNSDGSFHYAMGFDDAISEDDLQFSCQGVDFAVSPKSAVYADGMTIDFVELENKQLNFIFINPNDPDYTPAQE